MDEDAHLESIYEDRVIDLGFTADQEYTLEDELDAELDAELDDEEQDD